MEKCYMPIYSNWWKCFSQSCTLALLEKKVWQPVLP